jgi:hypothetical protein
VEAKTEILGRTDHIQNIKDTSTRIGQFPRTEPGDRPADVRRGDISREFTPPSRSLGNDWVLVLDDVDKNFSPPGAKVQR